MSNSPPGQHVLRAFGISDAVPEALTDGRDGSYRCGDAILTPVGDPAQAAWIASVLEHAQPNGVRVARPLRSSDGRWVVAGWSAQRFLAGVPEPRYDDIIVVSHALHEALAEVPEPRFLAGRDGVYADADRLTWGASEDPPSTDDGVGTRLYVDLARGRGPVGMPSQLIHGDLFGTVLFAAEQDPAVVDLSPYWRPAGWAAAILVVDAVAWGGADVDLVERWDSIPEWPEMLRRALMFRLAVSLMHPRTTTSSLVQIMTAAEVIRPALG